MEVTPLSAELVAPLHDFFARVPQADHASFQEDLFEPGLVERWLADERARRAVATSDGRVVG